MKNTAKHSQWVLVLLLLLTQTITPTIVLLSPKKKKIDLDTPKKSIKTTEALKKSITKVTKNSKFLRNFHTQISIKLIKSRRKKETWCWGQCRIFKPNCLRLRCTSFWINTRRRSRSIRSWLVLLLKRRERRSCLLLGSDGLRLLWRINRCRIIWRMMWETKQMVDYCYICWGFFFIGFHKIGGFRFFLWNIHYRYFFCIHLQTINTFSFTISSSYYHYTISTNTQISKQYIYNYIPIQIPLSTQTNQTPPLPHK